MCRALAVGCAALLLVACEPAPAASQDWQTVTSARQRADESSLDVHLRYGAGRLEVSPADGGEELYRVGIRYDAEHFTPITEYRPGRLEVGVEGASRGIRMGDGEGGEMSLQLSTGIPLDLDLDFGAVAADIELGGLDVRDLEIQTGASDTDLRFSSPNAVECERLDLDVGAAAFRAEGLGNANCGSLRLNGGVGDVTLEFGGVWRRNMAAEISMALGSLTLVIPEDVGVRVDRDTFLTGLDGQRMEERDGVHYSSNWESARYRLDIELSGAFGSVNIRWRNP